MAPSSFTYDVFLSFCGVDTRFSFTGNLYKALHERGINAFIDDKKLERGEEITPSLLNAIEHSKIAIIVLSENYAFSSFCLDELSKILDCMKEMGQLVWPVFYQVDPSDVRKLSGTYGEAMAMHEQRFKDNLDRLINWKIALYEVANLSGWHFKHGVYEHDLIRKIVEEVARKINPFALPIADYPVGLETQVSAVISPLDVELDDRVHMVGIYGTGGIGKTTLALSVYNSVAIHFESLCFLEDVRENSKRYGLLYLQKILLSKTVGREKLTSVKEGSSIIQHRLRQKKVLLVLDDVDKMEQLEAVAGRSNWFGPGSRVIITTRDKHLLERHGVERTYEVTNLNEDYAYELLTWKAFKTDKVDPSYVDILNRAVNYASGLPLALEVIGSNLFGKSIEEWDSALDLYEKIPNKKIQETLEVSFYALEEEEQSVFLDIACFFKGYRLPRVKEILQAHHGIRLEYHIGVLVKKSLIKISQYDVVTLHDLIEDMCKEFVRRESPNIPAERSRLWSGEDIVQVLETNTGTSKIEVIILSFRSFERKPNSIRWDGKAFMKMENLKTLIIKDISFSKAPEYLPNSLRLLEWGKYPSLNFPSDFHPKELTICKLDYSDCNSFKWAGFVNKKFEKMRVLNLDNCTCLTQTPDVSSLPNLEEFSFQSCMNLTTVHHSVEFLVKLKILNATSCFGLKNFSFFLKLASLEKLQLSFCSGLESITEIGKEGNIAHHHLEQTPIQNLTPLQTLHVDHNGIFHLPNTVVGGGCLLPRQDEEVEVVGSTRSSNVEYLDLSYCYLSDEFLAKGLKWFTNVKELDLSNNKFTYIPECIKEFQFLWKLVLAGCIGLQEIKGIPPNLENLSLDNCKIFQELSQLTQVPPRLKTFSALNCESLTPSFKSKLLNQFRLPRAQIPCWFEHLSTAGRSISFWFRNKFPDMAFCVLSPLTWTNYDVIVIINGKKFFYRVGTCRFMRPELYHIHLFHMQKEKFNDNMDNALLENKWNRAEVNFRFAFHQCGIHLLDEKSSMEDFQFTDPYDKREIFDLNLPLLRDDDVDMHLLLNVFIAIKCL
ncbi:disease resistance protein RUN1-like isoform X2 [Lotus japonicus]|uniref:disease resistance protein RUN1-like isoform X2 n=1 Tax=Lotus japonicus TaxID=34305 RepID=UPI002590C1F9|nr:disease resistance protein RUN1-like isoform X2 [Lotus japonicus]